MVVVQHRTQNGGLAYHARSEVYCRVPGKLRQFVLDLHSGKLHREFHHGPDPTEQVPTSDAQVFLSYLLFSVYFFLSSAFRQFLFLISYAFQFQ